MDFLLAAKTDIGISKKTNQDCYDIRLAKSAKFGNVLFAIVCDGMGGLKKGEVASATVTKEMVNWFETKLPLHLEKANVSLDYIKTEWTEIIENLNIRIRDYGTQNGFNLGTTLVALLIIGNKIYTANVGDSRIYRISNDVIRLTTDQSLVQQKIASGELSPEDEETYEKRNVLLQCVGASIELTPEIKEYALETNTVYLLCSDGFRHEITESEMLGLLSPNVVDDESMFNSVIEDIIVLLKKRQEKDNITAIAIKSCG